MVSFHQINYTARSRMFLIYSQLFKQRLLFQSRKWSFILLSWVTKSINKHFDFLFVYTVKVFDQKNVKNGLAVCINLIHSNSIFKLINQFNCIKFKSNIKFTRWSCSTKHVYNQNCSIKLINCYITHHSACTCQTIVKIWITITAVLIVLLVPFFSITVQLCNIWSWDEKYWHNWRYIIISGSFSAIHDKSSSPNWDTMLLET